MLAPPLGTLLAAQADQDNGDIQLLSGNGAASCASCHNPALGFADGLAALRAARAARQKRYALLGGNRDGAASGFLGPRHHDAEPIRELLRRLGELGSGLGRPSILR